MKILPLIGTAALSLLPCLAAAAPITVTSPLTPKQSLAAFKIETGLRIELAAAEPLVVAPVAIAFDEQGRMFVAEGRGYPNEIAKGKPPLGRIALLEDTDGDGYFDRRNEYAAGIDFPCGVLPWRGGVFVASAPDILYLKDTDGDGRADIRRVVLTGFDREKRSTQHFINSPALALDNWIYLSDGVGGPSRVYNPEHPERGTVESSGRDWRFRPDTLEVEAVSGYGQFGLTFDDAGHRFVCYNRLPIQHRGNSETRLHRQRASTLRPPPERQRLDNRNCPAPAAGARRSRIFACLARLRPDRPQRAGASPRTLYARRTQRTRRRLRAARAR